MMTKESKTMKEEEREEMLLTISDLSKDARGYRVRMDYAAMSDEELTDTWDGFLVELDWTNEREAKELEKALADYEKEVAEVIALGAGSRKRALLWMLDSEEGDMPVGITEVEHWMYKRGLLGETKIKDELVGAMKPIWADARYISV